MHYDPQIDALLIELRDAAPVSNIDYDPGFTTVQDADGLVIAIGIG